MRTPASLLTALLVGLPLAAQEPDTSARFRVHLGLAGGNFEHDTDGSPFDGDTDAGMFRLGFEVTSHRGFGGGVRLEGLATDDDLFVENGFAPAEIGVSSMFGHFTYRVDTGRFELPLRAGVLLTGYSIADAATEDEDLYFSFGPYLEVAPEFRIVDDRDFSWSLYCELGAGFGGTAIDLDNDPREYTSTSSFLGAEVGTRFLVGPIELGLGYVNRWWSVDESDPEGLSVVPGFDSDFHGLLFTVGAIF